MPPHKQVKFILESRQSAENGSLSDAESMTQTYTADLFIRNEALYYRYDEIDAAMGQTTTTIKVKEDEISVLRHGDVSSEQRCSMEAGTSGFFRFSKGTLFMQLYTRSMEIALEDGFGHLKWRYDLFLEGEHASTHSLHIKIEPLKS